ncbi:MAG: dihydrolipoyl dehydrogenase [Bdellovibrionales bacterium]|nr:dihydrolipoyl dehydrogenase [Bdellovibrionales bacterium]
MSSKACDVIVLGSGPGGYVAAIRASQLGRKVTIVERSELGGICLNWGCIPSKALLRSAQLYQDIKHADEFGFEIGGVKLDFPKVIERSRGVASKMEKGVNFLMKKNKVEIVKGTGRFDKPYSLIVTDDQGKATTLTYKDIIIATGARAKEIPNLKVDGKAVHTYRTALDHRILPQKLLVIGAGAIGMEFAYFYSSFGSKVTVVEMMDQVLPVEDKEIADGLERILTKRGMTIKTGTKITSLKHSGTTVTATLESKGVEETWSGDCCLVAIGVNPNTENLGLEKVGIATDERGFIKANEYLETSVKNHYAIGDVIGAPMLAHKASHEGIIAAESLAGGSKHPMKYDNIPGCTYCQPQVASIGLTEKAAKEKGIAYRVGKVPFQAIGKAVAIGEPEGFIKVLVDDKIGEVLGVHILHSEATELIAEAAVIRTHEAIAASVVDTIHPHPTLSEAVMEAMAAAIGRPINT